MFLLPISIVIIWTILAFYALGASIPKVERLKDWVLLPGNAATFLGILGVLTAIGGFRFLHGWSQIEFVEELTRDFYANFAAEFISIGITVLIIDKLNERHSDQKRKESLIRQMRNRDNGLASFAVDELAAETWLVDGSLNGADLRNANLYGVKGLFRANLEGAMLYGANLQETSLACANLQNADLSLTQFQGADLPSANLQGAILRAANFQGAILNWANLQNSDMFRADLRDAYLEGADLRGAELETANLQGAKYDRYTKWPKGINPDRIGAERTDIEIPVIKGEIRNLSRT